MAERTYVYSGVLNVVDLPPEMLVEIFTYLDMRSLIKCGLLCKGYIQFFKSLTQKCQKLGTIWFYPYLISSVYFIVKSYRFRKAAYEKRFWKILNFYDSRLPIDLLKKCLVELGTQFVSLQQANFWTWNSRIFPIIRQSHLKYLSLRDSQMNEPTFENIVFGSESLEKLSIGGM